MPLQASKLHLLSEFGNKNPWICIFEMKTSNINIKMTKNRDADINQCLSGNEPLLYVTDSNRERLVYA